MVDELDEYLDTFKLKYDSFWSAFAYKKDDEVYLEGLSKVPILIDNLEIGKRAIEEFFENYNEQMLKWEKEDLEEIKRMSNEDILWNTVSAAQGDDWDGMFTSRGKKKFKMLREELERRLKEIKFL